MINEKLVNSLALSMPKIDSSVSRILNQQAELASVLDSSTPKIGTSLNHIMEQQAELASVLDFSMPKIDTSILEKLKTLNSVLDSSTPKIGTSLNHIMEQQAELASVLDFSMPKIDTSILEKLKTLNIYLKSIEIDKVSNIKDMEISEQDTLDVETISSKINNKIELTEIELFKYIKILYFIMEKFIIFYTIYTIVYPNNEILIQLKKMEQNYKEQIFKNGKITNTERYYEVTKKVNIRMLPNTLIESKIIDIAFQKQKLLIISNKSYWLQVEYFNKNKQETIIGWVSKRYTKRLANEL